MTIRRRTECRLCDSRRLTPVLSLTSTPLANQFVPANLVGTPQERYPLDLYLCQHCGHLQLLDVVDPELVFRNYPYVSSTSPVFVEHFRHYAEVMARYADLRAGALVVDVGSNDGTLLRFFRAAGMRVLGVDPAIDIARRATEAGIETLPEFFTPQVASAIRVRFGAASLVTANNVFAHADDLHGIAEAVVALLAPDGLFVFEVSYLLDVVQNTLFDTIYHEHLSYHTAGPLVRFFDRHGLELIDAQRVPTHGGSLRGIVAKKGMRGGRQATLDGLLEVEAAAGLRSAAPYNDLADRIGQLKSELTSLLRRLKGEGKKFAGYGAPAKATTLMFQFELGREVLDYLVDDSPFKQGLFSPGYHIPIVPSALLYEDQHRPDYVLILAWNFAEPIMQKHQRFAQIGGHFVVPLPALEVR